jgi:hypothetical protein
MFHVEQESLLSIESILHYEFCIMNYLIYTNKTEISEGETPLMRDACPIVEGRIFDNF